jgi:hypothetical protein
LDLWEEEDDADDARPTIVAERPTSSAPLATGATGATGAAGADPGRASVNLGRTALVQRLIRQGALEEEVPRNSSELLRDSEVDSLTLVEKEPFSAAFAAQRAEIAQVESEPATEDAVPTVSVKRQMPSGGTPLPALAPLAAPLPEKQAPRARGQATLPGHGPLISAGTPLPAPAPRAASAAGPLPASGTPLPGRAALPASGTPFPGRAPLPSGGTPLPAPAPIAKATALATEVPVPAPKLATPPPRPDREVTERISIPSAGMAGSIAPTTRTARPNDRERKGGMPLWQGALAAALLLGGGLSIAMLRESRSQVSSTSIATPREAAPAPVQPIAVAQEALPNPPVVVEPAPPVTAEPVQAVPSAVPEPILPPKPSKEDPTSSSRRMRVARPERRALAAQEPSAPVAVAVEEPAPEPVAKPAEPEAPPAPALPGQPSRDQVTAALNAVVPELQKCVGDRHDTADVTITVRPAGFVSYAVVAGPFAGSAEGSCIARAVKAAKFPAFSDPTLRITYPFQL